MPVLSRWMIKAALLQLLLFVCLPLFEALLSAQALSHGRWLFWTRPSVIHVFVFGWVLQLIFGVAHWLFPRYSKEFPRGNLGLMWSGFVLLNLSVVLRLLGEMLAQDSALDSNYWLAVSAVSGWFAILCVVINLWRRVR